MRFKLPSGHTAYIDKEDAHLLEEYKWHLVNGYVQTEIGSRTLGTRKTMRLHRMILSPSPNELVDHEDRNPLNNRRRNLRLSNKSTNGMNRIAQKNSKSGLKGISWSKQKSKWRITCTVNGKQYHLGYAKTIEKALKKYKAKIRSYHGEFTCV